MRTFHDLRQKMLPEIGQRAGVFISKIIGPLAATSNEMSCYGLINIITGDRRLMLTKRRFEISSRFPNLEYAASTARDVVYEMRRGAHTW